MTNRQSVPTPDPLRSLAEAWFNREMDRIKADPKAAQQRALDMLASETLATSFLEDLCAVGMLASITQDKAPFDASLTLAEYISCVRQRYLLQGPPFKIADKG